MLATSILGQALAIGAGVGVYWAADRGWLGWRLRERWRAIGAGLTVVLLGGGVASMAVEGVRADGLVGFGIFAGAAILVVIAGVRHVRYRWPTVGVPVLAAVGACAVVPGLGAALLGVLGPFIVLCAILWWAGTCIARRA